MNEDDEGRKVAKGLVERLGRGEWGKPLASECVVDELLTLARSRTGSLRVEQAARQFVVPPDPACRDLGALAVGPDRLARVCDAFDRHRADGISFTDASILETISDQRAAHVLTFDRRLAALARGRGANPEPAAA